ncbi:DUF4381 domain-containing protein [Celerinatantimonas sp. YJH-8]|uniref:DUF4381 domain-containing protein n=1 Tax=Celerinatantimonas sp. YJH-8 TaxID=3228714 RepID=UPI0038BF88FA
MPTSNPLIGLRDIIVPSHPETALPAIGWWILYGAIIAVIIISMMAFYLYRKKRRLQRIALKQLNDMEQQQASAQAVNTLLKQVAQAYLGRDQVASLTAQEWFVFLNQQTTDQLFSKSLTESLCLALYQGEFPATAEQIQATRRWIKKALPPRRRRSQ